MAETKVLVVDDESKIRDYFYDFLQHEGFEVHTAENGEIAINNIDQDFYDVVIIDLNMPKAPPANSPPTKTAAVRTTIPRTKRNFFILSPF